MALCPGCGTVIPCHCHLAPPVQIRPGVYVAAVVHGKRDDKADRHRHVDNREKD